MTIRSRLSLLLALPLLAAPLLSAPAAHATTLGPALPEVLGQTLTRPGTTLGPRLPSQPRPRPTGIMAGSGTGNI